MSKSGQFQKLSPSVAHNIDDPNSSAISKDRLGDSYAIGKDSKLNSAVVHLTDSCAADGKNEVDEREAVSYFNRETGTSIIRVTAEMFKKSSKRCPETEASISTDISEPPRPSNPSFVETVAGAKDDSLRSSEETWSTCQSSDSVGQFSCADKDGWRARVPEKHEQWHVLPHDVYNDSDLNVCELHETGFDVTYLDDKVKDAAPTLLTVASGVGSCTGESRLDGGELISVVVDSDAGFSSISDQCISKWAMNEKGSHRTSCAATDAGSGIPMKFTENRDSVLSAESRPSVINDLRLDDCNSNLVESNGFNTPLGSCLSSNARSKPSVGPLRLTTGLYRTSTYAVNCHDVSCSTSQLSAKHSPQSDVGSFMRIPSLNVCTLPPGGMTLVSDDQSKSSVGAGSLEDGRRQADDEHQEATEHESPSSIAADSHDLVIDTDAVDSLYNTTQSLSVPGGDHIIANTLVDHPNMNYQSDRLRKLSQRQRKQQKNSGFVKASEVVGYVGDRTVEELLNFIDGKKTDTVAGGKASQKAKKKQKQNEVESSADVVVVDEETQPRLNTDDGEKQGEVADVKTDAGILPNGLFSTEETLKIVTSNGPDMTGAQKLSQEESGDVVLPEFTTQDAAKKEHSATRNGFTVPCKVVENIPDMVSSKPCEQKGFTEEHLKAFENNPPLNIRHVDSEPDLFLENPNPEEEFVLVKKKKKIKNKLVEKTDNDRVRPRFFDMAMHTGPRSQPPTQRKQNGNFSKVNSERYAKSGFVSRNSLDTPWSAVFKDKQKQMQVFGSSSEASSTCSAPVFKIASVGHITDEQPASKESREESLTSEVSNDTLLSTTEQPSNQLTPGQQEAEISDDTPVPATEQLSNPDKQEDMVSQLLTEQCDIKDTPIESSVRVSTKTESNRSSGCAAVVFHKRVKAAEVSQNLGFSFGFSSEEEAENALSCDSFSVDVLPASSDAKSAYSQATSHNASGIQYCSAVPILTSGHPMYPIQIANQASVITHPNHGQPTMPLHPTFVYTPMHPHSSGANFIVPYGLPVGIVPPTVMCDKQPQTEGDAKILTQAVPCTFITQVLPADQMNNAGNHTKVGHHPQFDLSATQRYLHSQYQFALQNGVWYNPQV